MPAPVAPLGGHDAPSGSCSVGSRSLPGPFRRRTRSDPRTSFLITHCVRTRSVTRSRQASASRWHPIDGPRRASDDHVYGRTDTRRGAGDGERLPEWIEKFPSSHRGFGSARRLVPIAGLLNPGDHVLRNVEMSGITGPFPGRQPLPSGRPCPRWLFAARPCRRHLRGPEARDPTWPSSPGPDPWSRPARARSGAPSRHW